MQKIFAAYGARRGAAALIGSRWKDARGTEQSVHVRIQNLLLDYPVVAQWTGTLQGQACFCCTRRKKQGFHGFGLRVVIGWLWASNGHRLALDF